MKKICLLVMPLMAISLLTNCGGNNTPQTVEHVVTFILNGATSNPIEPVTVPDGGQIPSDKKPADPIKPGHDFLGWSLSETSKNFVDLDTATFGKDTNLYAYWGNPQSINITFDANGGYFDTTTTTKKVVSTTYGQIPVAPTPIKIFAKETSTFIGWDKPLTPAKRASEGGTTIYKAQWDDVINKCHVVFNANGGTITEGEDEIDVDYGSTIYSTSAPTVTRQGYEESNRWDDASGNEFKFGETTVIDHMTLYAHWGEIKKYNVKFVDINEIETVFDEQTVEYNHLVQRPITPTKIGYTFEDWYTTKGKAEKFDFSKPLTFTGSTNVTIYGNFVQTVCKISYVTNGGILGEHVSSVSSGSMVKKPVITRVGYDADEVVWFEDEDLKTPFQFEEDSVPSYVYHDMVLYAQWSDAKSYTIQISGDNISETSASFYLNDFTPFTKTVSVDSGYILTKNIVVNPSNAAEVKIIDSHTLEITPKENIESEITLSTEKRNYYYVTASGNHLTFCKDEEMKISLSSVVLLPGEDFEFYMLADEVNSTAYVPPDELTIKRGDDDVINYSIEPVEGEYQYLKRKVTISGEEITGDIVIEGDAVNVGYYQIEFPQLYGLKQPTLVSTYFADNEKAVIEFQAEGEGNEETLLTKEDIGVNLTNEEDGWITSYDAEFDEKCTFEHTSENKYILTIKENVVDNSVNVVNIIARAHNYKVIDEFDWEKISKASQQGYAPAIFSIGDTKSVEIDTVIHTVRIIDFYYDELATPSDSNHQYAGITFEFADVLKFDCPPDPDFPNVNELQIYNEHWGKYEHYNYDFINDSLLNDCLQSDGMVYQKIPDDLMNVIRPVKKSVETYKNNQWENSVYETRLFPLSYDEILGANDVRYKYYKNSQKEDRMKYEPGNPDKALSYWLRTPDTNPESNFAKAYCITNLGIYETRDHFMQNAVAPAFCV